MVRVGAIRADMLPKITPPKRYRYYGSPKDNLKIGTKGWGPWRYDFYSICSAPYGHDKDCPRCAAGNWYNVWWDWIKSKILLNNI